MELEHAVGVLAILGARTRLRWFTWHPPGDTRQPEQWAYCGRIANLSSVQSGATRRRGCSVRQLCAKRRCGEHADKRLSAGTRAWFGFKRSATSDQCQLQIQQPANDRTQADLPRTAVPGSVQLEPGFRAKPSRDQHLPLSGSAVRARIFRPAAAPGCQLRLGTPVWQAQRSAGSFGKRLDMV